MLFDPKDKNDTGLTDSEIIESIEVYEESDEYLEASSDLDPFLNSFIF